MQTETSFMMIKPDAYKRGLCGEIIKRAEQKGLTLKALKLHKLSKQEAEELYSVHSTKPFFSDLIDFITSGPVAATVWEGRNAVLQLRKLAGATNPADSGPGTIRGDFSLNLTKNTVHTSDSAENALKEMSVFFKQTEIL